MTKRGLPTNKSARSAIAAITVAVITTASIAAPSPASAAVSVRFGGANRYDTARIVSEEIDDCTVAFANGEAFADGLTAAVFGLPILLTRADALPPETIDELERLDAKCNGLDGVGVIGGTAAVSAAVYDQLEQYSNSPPLRLPGANRYETAVAVALHYDAAAGIQNKTVALTTGRTSQTPSQSAPVRQYTESRSSSTTGRRSGPSWCSSSSSPISTRS